MNDATTEKLHSFSMDGSADYSSGGRAGRSRPVAGRQPVTDNGGAVVGSGRVLVGTRGRQALGKVAREMSHHRLTVFFTTFGFLTAGWWFWW